MDDLLDRGKRLLCETTTAAQQLYDREASCSSPHVVYRTIEDFHRCPADVPKLVVIGCTGAGKSTMLNVMAGKRYFQDTDYRWHWSEPPIFEATHGCNAVTKATSFANVEWFGDPSKPLVVVDTPGHDDTEGKSLESQESRDALRSQAADLHNKLKAIGTISTILVLHNQVASNRLNPATYLILKMIDEKFGPSVWKNVVVAYSQCNHHTEASWKADIESKKSELQREIKAQIPGCDVEVPVLALGGGLKRGDYITRLEEESEFGLLWGEIDAAVPIATRHLRPFEGAHWQQYEKVVEQHDEAVFRAEAAGVYITVLLKLSMVLGFLFYRSALLPDWLSVLLLNVPYTSIDEVLILMLFVGVVGPHKCKYSLVFFFEQWVQPRVEEFVSRFSKDSKEKSF